MLRWVGVVLALLLCATGLIAFIALRDNPGRETSGTRGVADADGAEIHYFASGPEEGPAVALVPSFARPASDFNELVEALAGAGYRTLAMQPRGIDGSTLTLRTSLHTYAADLAAALSAAGASGPAVVVGHAYGNRVARAFASDFPERARALVLLAAGGEDPTPPEMTAAIARAMYGIHPDALREQAIRSAFFAEGTPVPAHWMRGWYPLAGLAQAGANHGTPFAEWGAGGSAPILVLQPAEDVVAATGGSTLLRRFPERVDVVDIEGAAHAILPEQPERVAAVVLAYLAELP